MPAPVGLPVFPAEWSPQSAVLLTWPHAQSDWAERLEAVEPAFAAIVAAIAARQLVMLVCYDAVQRVHVEQVLRAHAVNMANVSLYIAPSNDTWTRDYGPLTVMIDGRPHLIDFRFNGWGGKYPAELDDRITQRLQEQNAFGNTSVSYSSILLEGGSLDSDGAGTLLTTERCLLGPTRNPTMSKTDYERLFKTQLGVERVFWIVNGELAGDDTDGHIDMLARFCNRTTIAYMSCEDPHDDHYATLRRMHAELLLLRTTDGHAYQLVPLPLPQAKFNSDGRRLPASYANFLIINGAVLVPTYADPNDARALQN
jgi:agmatine deiminase